jgi:hypothetical protein
MTKTDLQIVKKSEETRRTERPDDPDELTEIGQWYWVQDWERDWDDEKNDYGEPYIVEYLACVIEVGSNYAQLQGVESERSSRLWRLHDDEFPTRCRLEPDPQSHINQKIAHHQAQANMLMGKVQQLTAKLGITRATLTEGEKEDETKALMVVQGTENVDAYKTALVKAKEETIPDLFKRVQEEHEIMAGWMKANLLPYEAQKKRMEKVTGAIEDKIFMVELYAGLIEEMVKVKDGEPAPNDTKIHLFQRRHYMDEECLWNYKAGGMDFTDIEQFDRWLCRRKNLERILPHTRCVVSFRVRRNKKKRRAKSMSDFINIIFEGRADEQTFLYLRNGEQVWRLSTGINFGEELFPHKEDSITLGEGGGEGLWANVYWDRVEEIISDAEYQDKVEEDEAREVKFQEELAAWRADPKNKKHLDTIFEPHPHHHHRSEKWVQVSKDSVWYDAVMQKVAHDAMQHNRVAVVLQGILDRSPAMHPHPPWQLFTGEGFQAGIELVYDTSRALVDGDPPDFELYWASLNSSLTKGCVTVGQQDAWERHEAEKENARIRSWRRSSYHEYEFYKPYGNPGPGEVATVVRMGRKGTVTFEWYRERMTYTYGKSGDIKTKFTCPADKVLNVTAYTPGDYKQFYNDPRTRADYENWAPLLLAAEDWHAAQRKRKGKKKTKVKKG